MKLSNNQYWILYLGQCNALRLGACVDWETRDNEALQKGV